MKIALVDDQRLFLERMRAILENVDEDFHIVGTAVNGVEAVELAERVVPDLILMDVRMPELDGVEATRRIRFQFPTMKIVMLTTFEDDQYVHDAMRYGASGYLLKSISTSELLTAIRAVQAGVVTIDPHIVMQLIHAGSPSGDSSAIQPPPPEWFDRLSRKERRILALVVDGYHNREIADHVHVADQTVRNYISSIYDELQVSDRVSAIRIARDSGLF
ncbi:MAG: response regulator transcription factor [Alkalispirochaeta sp.]